MCGIVGAVGPEGWDATSAILDGLEKLEYRGYDSAGVAVREARGFRIVKKEGRLSGVREILARKPLAGPVGIGHTRWATHGRPNTINAHPHRVGSVVLVHNGIIENYEELKLEVEQAGGVLISQTDSEVFGHLVALELEKAESFPEAVRRAFLRLKGSCTIAVVHDEHPDTLVAVKHGTPLVAALSSELSVAWVASDVQALLAHTKQIVYLDNGDLVVAKPGSLELFQLDSPLKDQKGRSPQFVTLDWSPASLERDGYEHFMLKEIFEQPRALVQTLEAYLDQHEGKPQMTDVLRLAAGASAIHIVACGTAWHAGMVGRYLLESALRVPVTVDLASEYRYREPVVDPQTLFIAVSQSGETADTLAAAREAKKRGARTLAICNVRGSSLTREVDGVLYTAAGPEIGVASTKAFTTQLIVFFLLADALKKGPFDGSVDLLKIPHRVEAALEVQQSCRVLAEKCLSYKGVLFIARGTLFPIALEGALKMKEISYIHAEGYAAGELKHGPIAMVDDKMAIVVLVSPDRWYDKTVSNLQEVKARGGFVIGIGPKQDQGLAKQCDAYLGMDFLGVPADAVLASVPLQFLAYYSAVLRGTDVDKPRNLAKSVTVE